MGELKRGFEKQVSMQLQCKHACTRPSPTEPTLSSSSLATIHPTNTSRLGSGSLPIGQRPELHHIVDARPLSRPSQPWERHQNPPPVENERGATRRTHTTWLQHRQSAETIPTPWAHTKTVSSKRQTVTEAWLRTSSATEECPDRRRTSSSRQ